MAKLAIEVGAKEANGQAITVLDVDGIIDGSTVTELEERFEQLKKEGRIRFIFDFKDLEYISSAGIGFFMKEADAAKELRGVLVLMHLSPRVSRIFELLDLLDFFHITESETDALAKIAQAS